MSQLIARHLTKVSQLANDAGYAVLNSPVFTGTPNVPTAAPGTNTQQAASTAFVEAAVATSSQSPVNNTGAASDVALAVGQSAYIDLTGTTKTVPLHIATADNQTYTIQYLLEQVAPTTGVNLTPNNTTYSGKFNYVGMSADGDAGYVGGYPVGEVGGVGAFVAASSFVVSTCPVASGHSWVSTKTLSKSVFSQTLGAISDNTTSANQILVMTCMSMWSASEFANDTTTAWTSLGTLTFPNTPTGRILITRTS